MKNALQAGVSNLTCVACFVEANHLLIELWDNSSKWNMICASKIGNLIDFSSISALFLVYIAYLDVLNWTGLGAHKCWSPWMAPSSKNSQAKAGNVWPVPNDQGVGIARMDFEPGVFRFQESPSRMDILCWMILCVKPLCVCRLCTFNVLVALSISSLTFLEEPARYPATFRCSDMLWPLSIACGTVNPQPIEFLGRICVLFIFNLNQHNQPLTNH